MTGARGREAEPVAVAVTRIVKPGCEREFEEALHAFVAASFPSEPGHAVHVLRPPPGDHSRRYGILRRFPNASARDAFYSSDAFRDWERRVAGLTEGERVTEQASGLEAWFTAPGRPIVPPPRWRMALVTLLGVYPLSLILPAALRPLLDGRPAGLQALIVGAAMVASLTWLVMPGLAKLLHGWLHPQGRSAP